MWGFSRFAAVIAVLAGALALASPASATTFCVPGFFEACPNSGGNVAQPNLALAVTQNGSDGNPDTVYIDEMTYASAGQDSLVFSGTDELNLFGSGRDKTIITSSAGGNIYLVLANNRTGQVTMKDLALVVPSTFPDGNGKGSAIQARDLDLERVDVIVENNGSSAISNLIGGGNFDSVRIFGRNGAQADRGIDGQACSAGTLTITNSEITTNGLGIYSQCKNRPVVVERSTIESTSSAASVAYGASLRVENSVIRGGDVSPVTAYGNVAENTTLDLDQVTLVAIGDNTVAPIFAQVANLPAATGNVEVEVRNTLIAGYQQTWNRTAPVDPARGDANLDLAYSNFVPSGVSAGDGTIDQSTGNLNLSPGFVDITDFHLAPGSAMVDAGDPAAALPELDLEGNARPLDGNYDEVAVRDIGAYELNPPPPSCPVVPSLCPPDTTAPKVSKLKFRFKFGKGGAIRYRVSEAARIRIVLKPVPAGKGKNRRKVVRIKRGNRKGPGVITLGKRKLKQGIYRLVIRATDKAGNTSKPIVRKVRARR